VRYPLVLVALDYEDEEEDDSKTNIEAALHFDLANAGDFG